MNLSETDLLRRVHQLDTRALAEVYDHYSPGVFRYAMRLLGDAALAEDCVSETFSRLLQALHKGKGPQDHLQAYLYRIAHNWITDQYRRQPPPPLELDEALNVASSDDPQEMAVNSIRQERVRAALKKLPAAQQQVIILRYLEGWDVQEVAASLKRTAGAVKAIQHRATNTLRKFLAAQEDET
jgi:RNA polymerase sigma-70 factor (ECF subfamily)